MKILIPPSEGKSNINPSDVLFGDTKFKFQKEVEQVVKLLGLINNEVLGSVYGTTEKKALGYHMQNQDIFKSRCAPAIERYSGVVYENIDWLSMTDSEKNYMEKHVCIFSGLFGLLTPKTMIPNYKLKMNVLSLQNHWNKIITKELEKENLIFDLLPQVHRKAYTKNNNVINIDFLVVNKGKKKAAGHFGKSVKGKFIRFLAQNNIKKLDEFHQFEYDGFKWDNNAFIKTIN